MRGRNTIRVLISTVSDNFNAAKSIVIQKAILNKPNLFSILKQ